ncbi:leucine-rich repeat protein [Blautia sp. MSJ-19]|uniref:leucine-rich repeat protein n=1 Tax=Blautia sp. MSJ-19 TaxID=2841517 RepID=UPI001C0EB3A1|nr:leucine-rich repeat protein [Blautia sp. MSJ-19]MBU5481289.1 leucine-rich repeat domain-containing protein [Blautia sp. MSJ-19]
MIYLYRRNKTGICIDRVYGYDVIVELPDTLEGMPVTELGAYIFSDHIDQAELKTMQEKGKFSTEDGTEEKPDEDMPQAAGNRVEEIRLPRNLRKIGRYAFYNCFHLKKLTFYGEMQDLGAGALTGCHRMEQITMETDAKGESGLRDFLTELPETLCVDMTIAGEHGRFWFPEFFEEGVENTPARILENHVHGSGIRYRNSFVHKKLNTLEYDRLFPYAVAWEQERIVLNLALDRIIYPVSMTDEAKEKYLSYIKEHGLQAVKLLGEQKAYDSMQHILKELAPDRAATEKMLETAQQSEDSRWVSILMNELQKYGRKQRKAFEL